MGTKLALEEQMLAAGALLQGRYKIQEPLNEGGMSIVYLAEDSVLGNRVAVKEMKVHYLSPQERVLAAQQFLAEARILASLEHPGLPRVTNFFEQDARHYLVMDYIAGDTVEALVNQQGGHLSEEMVLRIAIGAARVLEYLHNLQPAIIFRDLKPSNIMLARSSHVVEDERGRLKLIDFGISKIFDDTKGTHTIIKGAGTPGYAPPEQYGAQGRARTTPRSDLYSLGATMYSLLTGQVPTEATDRWMNGEVLPSPRHFNEAVSSDSEVLVLQMMELKPEARPGSAREVIDRLQSILAAQGRSVAPPTGSGALRPVRRFRSSLAGPGADDGLGAEGSVPPPPAAPSEVSAPPASASPPPIGENAPPPSATVTTPPASGAPPPSLQPSAPAGPPPPPTPPAGSAGALPGTEAPSGPAYSSAPTVGALSGAPAPPPVWMAPSAAVQRVAPPPAGHSGGAQGLLSPVGPATPTMRGRPQPQASSPVVPVLVVIALLAVAFAGLSYFERLPFGGRGGASTPSASASTSAPSGGLTASTGGDAPRASTAPTPSATPSVTPTRLGIKASPSGARVFVDGSAAADATEQPTWSTIAPGSHTVKVRKDGYLPRTIKVEATASRDTLIEVALVAEATLRVTASPGSARVTVDEVYRGLAPITLRGLPEGNHRYKVSALDHITENGTIRLKPGQAAHLDLRLEPVHVAAPPPVYTPPSAPAPPVYRPDPPVYRPEPRATSVDVPAPRATPR